MTGDGRLLSSDPSATTIESVAIEEREWTVGAAAIWTAVAGVTAYMFMPILVGGLADRFAYSNSQLGLVAAAEALGMCLANVVAAFRVRHWHWRRVVATGAAVMVGVNVLSTFADALSTSVLLRLIDGMAGGVLIAVGVAALSDLRSSGRYFSFFVATEMTLSAVGFLVIPDLMAYWGSQALYLVLAMLSATVLLAAPFFAEGGSHRLTKSQDAARVPRGVAVATMGGALLFFTAQGGIWAFVERIGANGEISEEAIGAALAWSSVLGIAGALGATWVITAITLRGGLICVALGELLSIAMLVAGGSALFFTFGVGGFVFLWSLSLPLMLVQLNKADRSGGLVVMLYAIGKLGYAIGPALMGYLLDVAGIIVTLACGGALIVAGIACYIVQKNAVERGETDER